ncbi:hypothetical protein ACEUA8_01505 [Aeromonas veronii]
MSFETRLKYSLMLVNILQKHINEPFILGQRDCNTISAEVFDAVTKSDVYKLMYGRYKTFGGAKRHQTKLGLTTREFIQYYADRIDINLASSGDIFLHEDVDLGIFNIYWYLGNKQIVIANNNTGLIEVDSLDLRDMTDFECYRLTDLALTKTMPQHPKLNTSDTPDTTDNTNNETEVN